MPHNIVIVGGNFGAHVARALSSSLDPKLYNLILINARPFRFNNIACARMVVSDADHLDSEDAAFIPYAKLFYKGNGTFICGTVTAIEKEGNLVRGGRVVLADGQKIDFHVLVLATGSVWGGAMAVPDSPEDISRFLEGTRKMFSNSKGVVLVGGGPIAIEIAGEVRDEWPDKPVNIIHCRHKLLSDVYPDKFRDAVVTNLEARGIDVVLDDTVDLNLPSGATSVTTHKGKTVSGDLILPMWGTKPNTAYIAKSFGRGALAKDSCVRVLPTLQLPDHPEIFALGDMIDWPEVKQALKAIAHAKIVVANVLNYLKDKPLKSYGGSHEALMLTGGKNDGIGYIGLLWGIIVGAWLVKPYSARNLGVPIFRRDSGY
ncbi:FAD/NAD-P-binding domain-containing protein [Mucidula mucida]|nr:FAD/NAD-P-binding domain-containing protein [Mucidula mucida]